MQLFPVENPMTKIRYERMSYARHKEDSKIYFTWQNK